MSSTSANAEVDQVLRKAVKLLHSTHPDSLTEMRLMLDELIKQRYGPEKMLCNTLDKRYLDDEANFPGMVPIPPPQPAQPPSAETDEVINLTHSPAKTISDSPDTIMDSDDGVSGAGAAAIVGDAASSAMLTTGDDDGNLKDFGDLNCCVCGEMMFTATNRLIECSKCGALYHQECHKPAITNEEASEDQEHNWQCDTCCNKPSTSRAAGIMVIPDEPMALVAKTKSSATSSRSSSSSNSSSPFYKQEPVSTSTVAAAATTAPSASKHHHRSSSSSSRSHKEERTASSKSGGSSITGNVLAPAAKVSATEKSSSHSSSSSSSSSKKTSSHSSSLKSSSSKSSKHHESSSKRKAK